MFYGEGGEPEKYMEIEDQEHDFDMENSDANENNTTSHFGLFPFILYC